MEKILLKSTDLNYMINYDNCSIEELKDYLDDIIKIKNNIIQNFVLIYNNIKHIDEEDGDYIDSLLRYYNGLKNSITHLELTIKSRILYLEAIDRKSNK